MPADGDNLHLRMSVPMDIAQLSARSTSAQGPEEPNNAKTGLSTGPHPSLSLSLVADSKAAALIAHRASPSPPIYILPDDVLIIIFEIAYTHRFPHCYSFYLPVQDSPLCFSRVSRRFRSVALASPDTWSCIHVAPGQPKEHGSIINAHLAYSRPLPIRVMFQCYAPDKDCDRTLSAWRETRWPQFTRYWSAILAYRHRWKHVGLYFPAVPIAQQTWLQVADGSPFPVLRSLHVHLLPHFLDTSGPMDWAPLLTIDAASMQEIRLTEFTSNLDWSKSTRLRKLSIMRSCLTTYQLLGILSACHSTLTHLTCTLFDFEEEPFEGEPPELSRPRYLSLSIGDLDWHRFHHLISWPNLHSISISSAGSRPSLIQAMQSGAFSFPKVRFLTIVGAKDSSRHDDDGRDIPFPRNFIAAFPAVLHLKFQIGANHNDVLRDVLRCAIEVDGGTRMPSVPRCSSWPLLRTLTCEVAFDYPYPFSSSIPQPKT